MAQELMLDIVTPEKRVFEGQVDEVTVPGAEGQFGVLKGHTAFLSSVGIGELSFTQEGKKTFFAVNTGYAEVASGRVTILVETAERSDMIDTERARKAKERAEIRMAKSAREEELDYERMRLSLIRALTRLKVAEKS
ncbi:MAG: F0F1 ATP synthase subunit epsilon [Deltaproteobacteria bacterium]|jgi:F-type H+-transporting ATPase subunit epsilon|nr:F0F1 ATP synthase subunit epsilon [Deltaproteobacteria bacterium]